MANVTLTFIDGAAGVTFAQSGDESKAVANLFRKLRSAFGPLSVQPRDAQDLAERIANAFGGECALEIERPRKVA